MKELQAIHQKVNDIKDETFMTNRKLDILKSENSQLKCKILSQAKELDVLSDNNAKLEDRVNTIDRQQNRGKFILRGNDIGKGFATNGMKSVISNFSSKLTIPETRFESVLVSPLNLQQNKFLLEINDRNLLRDIFQSLKERKPTDLFFSDFLASFDNRISFNLRNLKRDKKIYAVSCKKGIMRYKFVKDSPFFAIRTSHDYDELMMKLQSN